MKKIVVAISLMLISNFTFAQTSTLVSVGSDGKLVYSSDSKGNRVPDFSNVGYMNSEAPIPTATVVKTVYAVSGDNRLNVQNAIDSVAALPLGANGLRGAILFKSGVYNISDTIKIKASGIVLRGEGFGSTGTRFVATKTSQHSLFYFSSDYGVTYIGSTKKSITNPYVPVGAKQITVASGHTFQVGDSVAVQRVPKQSWIDLLTMAQWGWTYSTYDINFERKITAVNGNVLTLDAPMVDIIDTAYATGEVYKYTSNRVSNCGIENMRISSTYTSDTDEDHGWEAVTFYNAINCWAKNLEVYYFGYSAVHILDGAGWITVDSCKMYDAKSIVDGGRRYSFNVDGQRCLVKNCITRDGRHDYADGSRTPGPNVFYNSSSTLQNNDIGPHHRWSTGILFDNIVGDGRMDVQNRTSSGSGHGWAGAQIMFWNCTGDRMVLQDPQGDFRNWAVGCVFNEITNIGDMTTEPLGVVESSGTKIAAIPSLFIKQLNERMTLLRQNQTITFPAISNKTISNADFNAGATASTGLAITYSSSNAAVATIVNGNIHIVGSGTSVITAYQGGDAYTYNEASATQLLTVTPVYTYAPTNATTTVGSACKCTVGNLVTNNSQYHVVTSTASGTRRCDWYGSVVINQPPASVTKLTINYDGKFSISRTQTLYLYNWSTTSWTQINSKTVSTTDVLTNYSTTSPSNFISSTGEIRLRVYSTGGTTTFKSSGDWMQFLIESTSTATSKYSVASNNQYLDAVIIEGTQNQKNKVLKYNLLQDGKLSASIFDKEGTLVREIKNKEFQKSGTHKLKLDTRELMKGDYEIALIVDKYSQNLKFTIN
jgi:hypothetical protein